jgi:hypothetical protein
MFDQNWYEDQAAYIAVIVTAIAAIIVFLVWEFRRKNKMPWPVFFVGIYNILLLFSYLFGIATQVGWEGFGSFPLLMLTTPWSWLVIWLLNSTGVFDSKSLANNVTVVILINLATFALSGAANSCILYFLLKRREKKLAEDEAWEQARRNR